MKKITAVFLAALLLAGCSSDDKSEESSDISLEIQSETTSATAERSIEELTTEALTNETPPTVMNIHIQELDLSLPENSAYSQYDEENLSKSEFEVPDFGTLICENGNITLLSATNEINGLIDLPVESETVYVTIGSIIDNSRFSYTIHQEDANLGCGVYDLKTGEDFRIEPAEGHIGYYPKCVSGDYLIMSRVRIADFYGYSRLNLNTYELEDISDSLFKDRRYTVCDAFSPDGKFFANIFVDRSGSLENVYTVSLISIETGELLEEYTFSSENDYVNFSMKFVSENELYVYADQYHPAEKKFLYIIDLEKDNFDNLNKRKPVFFSDSGYYYYSYVGGRDSANFVLSFDNGGGNPVPVENGEDCIWYYNSGDTFYGTKWSLDGISFCKCENNAVSDIFAYPQSYIHKSYFTGDYIYYVVSDDKTAEICRADYNGGNPETVLTLDEADYALDFLVYDNKIYYDAKKHHKLGIYDIETGVNTDIPQGGVGRIYNDYMYYINNDHDLWRMKLSDYSVEPICEKVFNYDFIGNDIVYSPYGENERDGDLFILENGVSRKIFSAQEFFGNDYYYMIDKLQYKDEHIFVEISSGPFYSYIAELDTDGNLVKTYYENKST
ncbi:MAG: DUF5050 domain-containing protein [Ruminococcus flavefaciens]|nr:DUF5050 domain-containing protein [Ruminococcus flavefaciens]MCM1058874.1 DUF5050 domain-containing protein [Eubacterium sp.]